MERVSPTPSPRHVPRTVTGNGAYWCRSNTKFIEWWHRIKKSARESVNPIQRYKLLKSVMGSGRVWLGRVGSGWVGLGRAAHTEISALNHRRTRSALRAPLVMIWYMRFKPSDLWWPLEVKRLCVTLLWTSSRLGPHFSAITFECVEWREPNFRNERFRTSGNFYYLGFLTPNKN